MESIDTTNNVLDGISSFSEIISSQYSRSIIRFNVLRAVEEYPESEWKTKTLEKLSLDYQFDGVNDILKTIWEATGTPIVTGKQIGRAHV